MLNLFVQETGMKVSFLQALLAFFAASTVVHVIANQDLLVSI
jgi:hypothetical protein